MGFRKALVVSLAGKYDLVNDVEMPTLRPDMMLCKVAAIALNPIDEKILQFSPTPGCIGGYDFAGEVVAVGSNVTSFNIGDRIFGLAFGLNPDDKAMGAFSDHVLATADVSCRIHPPMTFEEACTLGVALGTSGLAISQLLGCSLAAIVPKDACYVLVSGGATSTGIVAIQLLKQWGFKPIATCSPSSANVVQSMGAIDTFDYHSPSCGTEIRDYTKNSLAYVLDCVTSSEAMRMCYEAIGATGGRYCALETVSTRVKYTRRDVYTDWVMAPTLFGNPVKLAGVYGRPAMPSNRQLAAMLFRMAESLIKQGILRPPRYEIRIGGLRSVEEGVEDLRRGKIKGGKLVYPLIEKG